MCHVGITALNHTSQKCIFASNLVALIFFRFLFLFYLTKIAEGNMIMPYTIFTAKNLNVSFRILRNKRTIKKLFYIKLHIKLEVLLCFEIVFRNITKGILCIISKILHSWLYITGFRHRLLKSKDLSFKQNMFKCIIMNCGSS